MLRILCCKVGEDAGAWYWKNDIIILVMERIIEGLNDVAATYKEASGEPTLCMADDDGDDDDDDDNDKATTNNNSNGDNDGNK